MEILAWVFMSLQFVIGVPVQQSPGYDWLGGPTSVLPPPVKPISYDIVSRSPSPFRVKGEAYICYNCRGSSTYVINERLCSNQVKFIACVRPILN